MSRPRRALSTGERGVSDHRVALRPLSEADLPLVEPWYDRARLWRAAMASLRGGGLEADLRRHFEEAHSQRDRELLAIALASDGEVVGLLDRRSPCPAAGWLTVDFLAVAEPYRGRGLGSESVLALEEDARRQRLAHRFAAGVTADAGRALYFWLRLGYRPLLQADLPWPSPRRGVVWMVRETE
jgi:RimJ/RimL family protein N-acetyltransferase